MKLFQPFQFYALFQTDAEADAKKDEWLKQAAKELEDWDRNRKEQLEKTREKNR